MNDAVGTLSYTDSATDTLSGVDSCYTILDGYCILGTNLHAVAVSKTSIVAESIAAICHICGETGLVTLILEFLFYYIASAVTSNVSNLFNYVYRLNTKDGGDFSCGTVTAGDTEVGLVGRLVRQGLGIAVTSGISARATVCAGKTVTDSYCSFVFLDRKSVV